MQQNYHKHYYPNERSGVCVVRRHGESTDDLLKRFRKKFSKSGITKELRERMYYEKPSDKKRRKKMKAIRNYKREEAKRLELEEIQERMRLKHDSRKRKGKNYDQGNRGQNRYNSYEKNQNYRRNYSS